MEDTLVSSSVLDVPPRGQMLFDSYRESVVVSVSPDFHGSLSSEAWVAEAAKVEDGWIAVKRKKSKPFAPPLDMVLWSGKGNFKSKGKSYVPFC